MSALIRYFLAKGYPVAGYDKTSSPLTEELIKEGAQIVYDENPRLIPSDFKDPKNTLIVYTPAVPESQHGGTYICTISDRMQRLSRRNTEKLRQQSDSFRS